MCPLSPHWGSSTANIPDFSISRVNESIDGILLCAFFVVHLPILIAVLYLVVEWVFIVPWPITILISIGVPALYLGHVIHVLARPFLFLPALYLVLHPAVGADTLTQPSPRPPGFR